MKSHQYCFRFIGLSKFNKYNLLSLSDRLYRISLREDNSAISGVADIKVLNNKLGKLNKFSKCNKLSKPSMYLYVLLSELWRSMVVCQYSHPWTSMEYGYRLPSSTCTARRIAGVKREVTSFEVIAEPSCLLLSPIQASTTALLNNRPIFYIIHTDYQVSKNAIIWLFNTPGLSNLPSLLNLLVRL